MESVNTLLDRCKIALGVESDNQLAKKMNVGRAAVSRWRSGLSAPDAVSCAAIAGWTGEPLAKVLGIVGEARAISREEKAVWRKLAATAALLTVVLLPALSNPAEAGVKRVYDASSYALCEIKDACRWAVKYLRLWLSTRFGKPAGPYIEAKL